MKQICNVASDYLGLEPDDAQVSSTRSGMNCTYFRPIEDDPDHPHVRLEVCGNCIHREVVQEDEREIILDADFLEFNTDPRYTLGSLEPIGGEVDWTARASSISQAVADRLSDSPFQLVKVRQMLPDGSPLLLPGRPDSLAHHIPGGWVVRIRGGYPCTRESKQTNP